MCGYASQSASNTGVAGRVTALPGPGGASPQPSSTTSARDGTGTADRARRPGPGATIAGCGDDRRERLGLEAGAADQRAVDVGQRQQLGRVLGVDAAAVEDPRPLGLLRRAIRDQRADERDRLLRLLGRRDRPVPIAQIGS